MDARKFVKKAWANSAVPLGLSTSYVKTDLSRTIKSLIPKFAALGVQIDLDTGAGIIGRKKGTIG